MVKVTNRGQYATDYNCGSADGRQCPRMIRKRGGRIGVSGRGQKVSLGNCVFESILAPRFL
jgi:hypothetical protein